MLSAELRDFDTGINVFHDLVTYPIYLVAKNQCIFFSSNRNKLLEHNAFFGLFYSYYLVTVYVQPFNRRKRSFKVAPVYRLCCTERCFFYFAMRRLRGNAA